jgi:hypothetical protein
VEIKNYGRLCRADAEQSEESWMQQELVGCEFKDERLGKRFSMVLRQLSVRWVENVVDTMAALSDPGRCVHIGDHEADIYELFVPPTTWARISSCERAPTVWPRTGQQRLRQKWGKQTWRVCTASRYKAGTAIFPRLYLKSSIGGCWFSRGATAGSGAASEGR